MMCGGSGENEHGNACEHCSGTGICEHACCWMDAHGETRESLADEGD
jgi:hypothetical protein